MSEIVWRTIEESLYPSGMFIVQESADYPGLKRVLTGGIGADRTSYPRMYFVRDGKAFDTLEEAVRR